MADLVLKRDENFVTVLGAITDDAAQEIRMVKVNPTTGRVLVSATSSSGTVTTLTASTGITLTPNPITTTGTIAIADTAVSPGTYALATITVDQQGRITSASAGTAGTGTVTSVSVTTANGVSGSVATATSTPAITLVLGDITPSKVNGMTITSSTGTFTLTNGKTLAVSNTLTFTGTDASSVAFGTGGTVAYTANNLSVFAATTSAQLAGVISDETGSGALVFANTPTLVTPVLGVATATSINKVTITAPATSATLTIADGKTLTVSNSITIAGTDSTTMTFPSTSASIARTDAGNTFTGASTASAWVLTSPTITTKLNPTSDDGAPLGDTTHNWSDLFLASGAVINYANSNVVITHTSGVLTMGTGDFKVTTAGTTSTSVVTNAGTQTLSNKRMTRRVVAVSQSATPTVNTDNTDVASITGLAQAITSMTTNLSGTPVAGDLLEFQITDDGTGRALTFGASFVSSTVTIPTTTVSSTMLRIGFEWNSVTSKWVCVASA